MEKNKRLFSEKRKERLEALFKRWNCKTREEKEEFLLWIPFRRFKKCFRTNSLKDLVCFFDDNKIYYEKKWVRSVLFIRCPKFQDFSLEDGEKFFLRKACRDKIRSGEREVTINGKKFSSLRSASMYSGWSCSKIKREIKKQNRNDIQLQVRNSPKEWDKLKRKQEIMEKYGVSGAFATRWIQLENGDYPSESKRWHKKRIFYYKGTYYYPRDGVSLEEFVTAIKKLNRKRWITWFELQRLNAELGRSQKIRPLLDERPEATHPILKNVLLRSLVEKYYSRHPSSSRVKPKYYVDGVPFYFAWERDEFLHIKEGKEADKEGEKFESARFYEKVFNRDGKLVLCYKDRKMTFKKLPEKHSSQDLKALFDSIQKKRWVHVGDVADFSVVDSLKLRGATHPYIQEYKSIKRSTYRRFGHDEYEVFLEELGCCTISKYASFRAEEIIEVLSPITRRRVYYSYHLWKNGRHFPANPINLKAKRTLYFFAKKFFSEELESNQKSIKVFGRDVKVYPVEFLREMTDKVIENGREWLMDMYRSKLSYKDEIWHKSAISEKNS